MTNLETVKREIGPHSPPWTTENALLLLASIIAGLPETTLDALARQEQRKAEAVEFLLATKDED